MNKIEHHSLADWDYAVPGPYISDVVYVSAPSSLAAKYLVPFNRQGWAMCKLASAANVFDGKIINYIRFSLINQDQILWHYRAQANPAPTGWAPADTYYLNFRNTAVSLIRRVAASNTTLKTANFVPALSALTWYQFRHTWWQYLQPDMTKLLRHKLEQYKAGAWVEIFSYDDSQNTWAASAVNKVGFMLFHNLSPLITAIDNTEIWKRLT